MKIQQQNTPSKNRFVEHLLKNRENECAQQRTRHSNLPQNRHWLRKLPKAN
jgi:hypothetical protein